MKRWRLLSSKQDLQNSPVPEVVNMVPLAVWVQNMPVIKNGFFPVSRLAFTAGVLKAFSAVHLLH